MKVYRLKATSTGTPPTGSPAPGNAPPAPATPPTAPAPDTAPKTDHPLARRVNFRSKKED